MPVTALSAHTERVGGGVAVVHVDGEWDMDTASVMENELREAAGGAVTTMILDLTALSFFGSPGLGMLMEWQHKARERGFTLRVAAAHPIVRRPLTLTGLDKLLNVHDTVGQALTAGSDR